MFCFWCMYNWCMKKGRVTFAKLLKLNEVESKLVHTLEYLNDGISYHRVSTSFTGDSDAGLHQ